MQFGFRLTKSTILFDNHYHYHPLVRHGQWSWQKRMLLTSLLPHSRRRDSLFATVVFHIYVLRDWHTASAWIFTAVLFMTLLNASWVSLGGKGWKGVELWFLLLLLLLCLLLIFRAFNNKQLSVVIAESPTPSIFNSKFWVNFNFPVSQVSNKQLEQKKHKCKCSKATFHSKTHQSNPPKSYIVPHPKKQTYQIHPRVI